MEADNASQAINETRQNPMQKHTRNVGVDLGKLVAFISVVCIHVPRPPTMSLSAILIVDQLSRFGVPFFFIASGYFLSHRIDSAFFITRYVVVRIFPAFAFWTLFYFWSSIKDGPVDIFSLVFDGGGLHLWFFSSLILCLLLCSILLKIGGLRLVIVAAIPLYLIGLYHGVYGEALHAPHWSWNVRNGPFFGFPFVVIGLTIARRDWRPPLLIGAIMFLIGGVLQILEARMVTRLYHVGLVSPDFVAATSIYATGAFLFFRSLPQTPAVEWMSQPGRVVLGAYAIHPYILFMPAMAHASNGSTALVVLIVAGLSLVVGQAGAQIPLISYAFR